MLSPVYKGGGKKERRDKEKEKESKPTVFGFFPVKSKRSQTGKDQCLMILYAEFLKNNNNQIHRFLGWEWTKTGEGR